MGIFGGFSGEYDYQSTLEKREKNLRNGGRYNYQGTHMKMGCPGPVLCLKSE